jgi:hypothetical protein
MRSLTTEQSRTVRGKAGRNTRRQHADDVEIATNPSCPQGILQWQHGTVVMNANLSLSLTPFEVDGRQLLSDPCTSSSATYTRYNQSELFMVRIHPSAYPPSDAVANGLQKWQVYVDPYTKLTRLDLYEFDGSLMNPLFLAYSPPLMLPTVTLNPTAAATSTAAATPKGKRSVEDLLTFPLNKDAKHIKRENFQAPLSLLERIDLNVIWWAGVGMTIFGGAAYLL